MANANTGTGIGNNTLPARKMLLMQLAAAKIVKAKDGQAKGVRIFSLYAKQCQRIWIKVNFSTKYYGRYLFDKLWVCICICISVTAFLGRTRYLGVQRIY